MSCIFCRIASGEIPCCKVYENTHAIAFLDLNPLAPGHALVIPKVHAETLDQSVLLLFCFMHIIFQGFRRISC